MMIEGELQPGFDCLYVRKGYWFEPSTSYRHGRWARAPHLVAVGFKSATSLCRVAEANLCQLKQWGQVLDGTRP